MVRDLATGTTQQVSVDQSGDLVEADDGAA